MRQLNRAPVRRQDKCAGKLPAAMASTDENRTIAPIVGPDDPRHMTDSGIEIDAVV